jgi:hypothetical protein
MLKVFNLQQPGMGVRCEPRSIDAVLVSMLKHIMSKATCSFLKRGRFMRRSGHPRKGRHEIRDFPRVCHRRHRGEIDD